MDDQPTPRLPGAPRDASSAALDGGRFAPGTMLDARYRVIDRIGRGGMGEVYRAEDLKLGEPVALKFLPARLGQDAGALARLHQEVRTARKVSHPNVVRVHDIGEADGETFLSMELVSGEDLSSLINRIGRLPEEKGVAVARQLCAGLAAAHEKGVLHRDLKPSNVMMDGAGNVRISDFGLASLVSEQKTGEIAGTPAYMAPEQLVGRPLTVASEVYSLGLVLYEVFTGERLYAGLSRSELEKAHRQPPDLSTSRLSSLDPAVPQLLERCLAVDPTRRPRSAMVVAAALPGGDPLAAALAAGETPSPAMVADAGVEGTVRRWVAHLLLGLGVLGLVATVGFRTATSPFLLGGTGFEPPVLDHQAQRYLEAAGGEPLADGIGRYWLSEHYLASRQYVTQQELASQPHLPLVTYTYRAATEPVAPTGRWGYAVYWVEPPVHQPGTALVEMEDDGRLLRLIKNPSRRGLPPPAEGAVDLDQWFEYSGLEADRFRPVEPRSAPFTWADRLLAWEGSEPDHSEEMRVEAALRGQEVVYWRVGSNQWEAEKQPGRVASVSIVGLWTFVVMLFGGGLLAWRNAKLGRIDRRGAQTTAVLGGSLWCVERLSIAGAAIPAGGASLALMILAQSLLVGTALWTSYLALEPLLRRSLPHTLVSWNRLLRGRFSDPLLARDLLFGITAGFSVAAVGAADGYLRGWVDLRIPHGGPALWGLGPTLTNIAYPITLVFGLGILFLFALPRVFVANRPLADLLGALPILALAILGAVGVQPLAVGLALIGLSRWVGLTGLLGFFLAMANVSLVPVIWQWNSWWGPRSLLGPVVILALLFWSARTASRPQLATG